MSLTRLDAIAAALERLPDVLTAAVPDVVRDNAFLLELENQQQLEAGLNKDGHSIRPEYSYLTVLYKQEAGEPYDRVTLRDTGDFYGSIVAEVRGQALEMEATDPKTEELQEKYGEAILGLSDDAVGEFCREVLKPELQDLTRKTFGI